MECCHSVLTNFAEEQIRPTLHRRTKVKYNFKADNVCMYDVCVYVSPETIADAPAENIATGNLAPESVGTDSTTERAGHGQRQSVAPDSLGIDVHDWTAGVSLLQLSSVLDQFLPQRHIRRSIATATIPLHEHRYYRRADSHSSGFFVLIVSTDLFDRDQ